MNTKALGLVAVFFFAFNIVFAKKETEKFQVYGKCEMCKNRIEMEAKAIDGVSFANWNIESQMMEIVFENTKTSSYRVRKAIVQIVHDTDLYKVSDENYNKLPACCQYTRLESIQDSGCCHQE